MTRHRTLARMIITQLRLRFLIALVAFALACAALTIVFLREWHLRGTNHSVLRSAFGVRLRRLAWSLQGSGLP
jgi:hypothetical protein